ncbi:ribosomal protein S5 domain 2-like protein [Coccomyxa subellipsoidea C-169]|uniref:Ribosomal protein S5 domain 2-like protein n=1 Tax=Coccomyxa subellipsoidea (strain C-169) TaxID=574566 RepID=I0Z201_COCSC|nr:ribosomal protein S5 domain 2-like protein [Coccomyxa subellipsoidea C-169]EIE24670.1 ribosomal protein S5 domain 2-like protein [Coccomyxa subellipsoidea C-169]|eukprot:XP_005649214.1 ribosomal protein S5 domain 2-like protein [Coccomyxa subellipsoidea C-169]
MEFVSPEGLRLDGRRPKELRALRCQLGPLPQADGSALFEMGNTKVIATAYGPKVADNRSQALHNRAIVKCDYAEAAFSTGNRRQRRGRGDRKTTELASTIRSALEHTILLDLFPRAQIGVSVQVLQADGGVLGACINAAMLALANAGIPLRDMIAATSAGYLESTPLLDLNFLESTGAGPEVTLALHTNLDKVVILTEDSTIAAEPFEAVTELAQQGCKAVAHFMRAQLLQHVQTVATVRGLAAL